MRQGSFQGRPQNRNNNNNNRHRGPQNNGGSRQYNNNSNGGRPHRNQVLDSNGPDVRVRGTAFQINEKYAALAKDASSMGDWVLSERYLQFAEHYQRMINEFEPQQTQQPQFDANTHNHDGNDQPTLSPDEGTVISTKPMVQSDDSADDDTDGVRVVRRTPRPRRAPVADDDGDLGLPTSILGGDAVGA